MSSAAVGFTDVDISSDSTSLASSAILDVEVSMNPGSAATECRADVYFRADGNSAGTGQTSYVFSFRNATNAEIEVVRSRGQIIAPLSASEILEYSIATTGAVGSLVVKVDLVGYF